MRRAGAARVGEVTGRVAADLAVWVDDELVTAVVSEPADFVWLERRTGWFYLPSVAKNAVVSRVAKVLSVSGAVSLADLHAGIRRDERMREFVMPEYILAELCERAPGRDASPATSWSPTGPSLPRTSSRPPSSRCCAPSCAPAARPIGTSSSAPAWPPA